MPSYDVTLKITGREDVSSASVKAERSLGRLGDRGSRALKRIGTVGRGVRRSLQAVGRAVFSVKSAVVALLGALAARAAVTSVIDATSQQIVAETKLAQAISNVASAAPDAAEQLIAYAAELQRITGYGDETIINAQAMLATFQLNEKAIMALTPRLLDMAAALEKGSGEAVDLQAVAITLGKAFTGQVGMLSRYGIAMSEVQKQQLSAAEGMEKVRILTEILDQNFAGLSEAVGGEFPGRLRLLKADFGDLEEIIGRQFMPHLKPLIALASEYVVQLQHWVETHNVAVPVLRATVGVLGVLVRGIDLAGKAWLTSRAVVIKTTEVYRRGLAYILGAVEKAARVGQAIGLVSQETVREIARARTAQLEMAAESAFALIAVAEQYETWEQGIAKVQSALGKFNAAIVPQFEEVGLAGRRAAAALDAIGASKPALDGAAQAAARETAEIIKLNPALTQSAAAAREVSQAQRDMASSADQTTAALDRESEAARRAASALGEVGSIGYRTASRTGEQVRRRFAARFAARGAVTTSPTHLITSEHGQPEVTVPFEKSQRSPDVQRAFEMLAAREGGGDRPIVVNVYLRGRQLAKEVVYQQKRGAA